MSQLIVKYLLLVAVVLATLTTLYGQEGMTEPVKTFEQQVLDVIYMKSGTILKGQILSWDEKGYVTFKSISGFEMKMHQVTIAKVRQKIIGGKESRLKEYAFAETGFYHAFELGLSGDTGGGLSGTWVGGHMFNRWCGVGAGFGFESFEVGNGRNIVPVFGELRGYVLRKRITPYYIVRGGYGWSVLGKNALAERESQGGFMLNPHIGVRFGGTGSASFYMGVGAHFQKAIYQIEWPQFETTIEDRYLYKRTEIKFGLVF